MTQPIPKVPRIPSSHFAWVLKVDRFRNRVMMLSRRYQDSGADIFASMYINLN